MHLYDIILVCIHRHTLVFVFSSWACHNRLAGHYSDDGACINHNTGSPVEQVSRGCWREHAAMATTAVHRDDQRIRYHRRHTKKQTHPKKYGRNNSLRINKYMASSWVWDSIFYRLIFFSVSWKIDYLVYISQFWAILFIFMFYQLRGYSKTLKPYIRVYRLLPLET